jgi:hypothetical protein
MSHEVEGYESFDVQAAATFEHTQVREYEMPFNYPNVEVNRPHYLQGHAGSEGHGVEMLPTQTYDQKDVPPDHIAIEESDPVVAVTVIGSACTPPGFVKLEANPTDAFWNKLERDPDDEIRDPDALPLRFREGDLWGQHLRWDQFDASGDYEEFPLAGMSSATFDIPRSTEVRVMAGSEPPGWSDDQHPDDNHYSVRLIRTTVVEE